MNLLDSVVLDGVRRTKDGYLAAYANVARTGIQKYKGSELGRPELGTVMVYRSPEEVFHRDALKSMAHRPVTLTHPRETVDAKNWKKYAKGHTGDDVIRDGDHVRVPMVLMDAEAIEAVEKHGTRELSMGYSTELKWEPGITEDGEEYDATQTEIRANHLALVPAARGGSKLRFGDADLYDRDVSEEERESLAEKGKAMPDGSFPIASEGDLMNAIKAVGRAKNYEAAKKHIISRARAMGATAKLPDGWIEDAGDWNEYYHPRWGKGHPNGGKFVSNKGVTKFDRGVSIMRARMHGLTSAGLGKDKNPYDEESEHGIAWRREYEKGIAMRDADWDVEDADWDEEKHPRKGGKFTFKGGGEGKKEEAYGSKGRHSDFGKKLSPEELRRREREVDRETNKDPEMQRLGKQERQYEKNKSSFPRGSKITYKGKTETVTGHEAEYITTKEGHYLAHEIKKIRDAASECPKCGADVSEDDRTCDECGAKLTKDAADGGKEKGTTDMTTETPTVMIDGVAVEVADSLTAALITNRMKALDDAITGLKADIVAKQALVDGANGEIAVLKKKVEDAVLTPEKLDVLVADRSEVIAAASFLLDTRTYDFKGKKLEEIRRSAVAVKLGDAVAKEMSDASVEGAFKALTTDAPKGGTRALADSLNKPGHAVDKSDVRDEAWRSYNKDLTEAWKHPGGKA